MESSIRDSKVFRRALHPRHPHQGRDRHQDIDTAEKQGIDEDNSDLEHNAGMYSKLPAHPLASLKDLNHYSLVEEVWHWSSIDWGRKCKANIMGLMKTIPNVFRCLFGIQFDFQRRNEVIG